MSATTTAKDRGPDLDSLYCINEDGSRNKIHPADVRGRFQRRKKIVWTVLIGIYLAIPWIEVGGHPAVLLDIVDREFYLFGLSFNARDFYLAFFLITGLGFALYGISALYGRIWCGYSCPHTVFLDGVYRRVERWIDGGPARRKKLDEMPWNATKIGTRMAKWGSFAAISVVLSHTFLSYFMGMDLVLTAVTSPPSEHPAAFSFIVIFTVIIYVNFTWFREQLCIVICPYGRLQGVLYDRDTVNVGYDAARGEPRGRVGTEGVGDCIDCHRCVAVCPTGIDIRNGTQMECIGCANCVDACDEVMDKVGRPRGLVRYASQNEFEGGTHRVWRPRLFFYAAAMLVGMSVFTAFAWRRTPFQVGLLRQEVAPYQLVENGATIRNPAILRIDNKRAEPTGFVFEGVAAPGVTFTIPIREVRLAPFEARSIPVLIDVERARWSPGMVGQIRATPDSDDEPGIASIHLLGPQSTP